MAEGNASWNGQAPNEIEVEIDLDVLASRLAQDPDFIRKVASHVRKQLTKDARNLGNLFGKWAGR